MALLMASPTALLKARAMAPLIKVQLINLGLPNKGPLKVKAIHLINNLRISHHRSRLHRRRTQIMACLQPGSLKG